MKWHQKKGIVLATRGLDVGLLCVVALMALMMGSGLV